MRRKQQGLSLQDFGGLFTQGLTDAVSRPSIHNYKPHTKQEIFHKSTAKIKQLIGGNRSGKTVGGVTEDTWWMRGKHPYRRVPEPPTRGRIIAVSYLEGHGEIIIPELKRWLPPSDLINGSWEDSYSKGERKLTLSNGSTANLMSYEQDLEKFAGTSQHWIHFDEEPPEDIYKENRMRVMDTGGSMWMTMTPVEGMTWTYEKIHLPGLSGDRDYLIVIVDVKDNPYLSPEEIDEVLADLDEDEIRARGRGEYVQLGGLVYKMFRPSIHVLQEPVDPSSLLQWTQYQSLDHGLNNPTCWLWHAVSKDGLIITFDEIYKNETLVSEFADMIKERNSHDGRRMPEIFVGDPSIAQRSAINKMSIQKAYAIEGIPIILGNNDVALGVEKVSSYLKAGKWLITPNCRNLIREISRLRWKIYETTKKRNELNARPEIHKKNDHAPDSARYFFGLLPDLRLPSDQKELNKERIHLAVQQALSAKTYRIGNNIDWNLKREPVNNTEWVTVDEHMGGFW